MTEPKKPRESPLAMMILGMSSILNDLARFGITEVYTDAQGIEKIHNVVKALGVTVFVEQKKGYYIMRMNDSLYGE